jgi:hypothetical protein
MKTFLFETRKSTFSVTEVNESKPDPFKPPRPATAFDDNFDNKPSAFGDDDSWNTNQWSSGASDPFAGNKPDPFAANASPAKDVSFESSTSFTTSH